MKLTTAKRNLLLFLIIFPVCIISLFSSTSVWAFPFHVVTPTISHPYSAWERGANENMNGLLRQYFPKAQSFKTVTDDQISSAMHRLNNRPCKTLAFRTPFEVFSELSSVALVT